MECTKDNKPPAKETLAMTFDRVINSIPDEGANIGHVVNCAGKQGINLIAFLFSLPVTFSIIPMPPFVTSVLGLPLLYLAGLQIFGINRVVLPDRIKNISLGDGTTLKKTLNFSKRKIAKFQKIIGAKENFSESSKTSYLGTAITGVLGTALALYVMLPFPGTHTFPAMAITAMYLGKLTNSKKLIYGSFLYTAALFTATFMFGKEAYNFVKPYINDAMPYMVGATALFAAFLIGKNLLTKKGPKPPQNPPGTPGASSGFI